MDLHHIQLHYMDSPNPNSLSPAPQLLRMVQKVLFIMFSLNKVDYPLYSLITIVKLRVIVKRQTSTQKN